MNLPLFLIPMLVGLATQGIKPFFNRKWYAKLGDKGRKIPRYGGMPSAHTSFIFSLATAIAVKDGFMSGDFAIAAVLVIIVLDDALRMRIFLSRYGSALRRLINKLPENERHLFPYLESRLGHKLPEVVVGALIGITLTLVILFFMGS